MRGSSPFLQGGEAVAKTLETKKAEFSLSSDCKKRGWFGCLEVTIGWNGSERVDYMSIDQYGTIRCFEIKVSKQDFYSKAANSFNGNFNYYVMPYKLYEEVEKDILNHVGVFSYNSYKFMGHNYGTLTSLKKATKKRIENAEEMKMYLMRSMARECHKIQEIQADKFLINDQEE